MADDIQLRDLAAPLAEVVSSCGLGRLLFEAKVMLVVSWRLSLIIDDELDKLLGGGATVRQAAVDTTKEAILKRIWALDGVDTMEAKRAIAVRYGGVELSMIAVSSVAEQVDLAFAAALKALAVHQKTLVAIPCERVFTSNTAMRAGWTAKIDAALLRKAKAGRAALQEHLGDTAVTSSDQLMAVVLREVLYNI